MEPFRMVLVEDDSLRDMRPKGSNTESSDDGVGCCAETSVVEVDTVRGTKAEARSFVATLLLVLFALASRCKPKGSKSSVVVVAANDMGIIVLVLFGAQLNGSEPTRL